MTACVLEIGCEAVNMSNGDIVASLVVFGALVLCVLVAWASGKGRV